MILNAARSDGLAFKAPILMGGWARVGATPELNLVLNQNFKCPETVLQRGKHHMVH